MVKSEVDETPYFRMVFDDYAQNGVIEGLVAVKSSLLLLGIEEAQLERRLAAFTSGQETLAAFEALSFDSWLVLAKEDK